MKTLGQIAYEASPESANHRGVTWEQLSTTWHEYWQTIADAVAKAAKTR